MKNRPMLEKLTELGLISQLEPATILRRGEEFLFEATFQRPPVFKTRAIQHLKEDLIKLGSAQEVLLFGYNNYKNFGQTKYIIGRKILDSDNIQDLLFVLQQEFAEKNINAVRVYIIGKSVDKIKLSAK